jgi:site-specific recombinase XerD
MNNSNSNPDNNPKRSTSHPAGQAESQRSGLPRPKRSTGKSGVDPHDYGSHPYPSMQRFAGHLVLSHDTARTRQSYYRQMRLIHEHFGCDPEGLGEEQLRDYILHVKTRKGWRPKTIRQAAAAARLFYAGMLGREEWRIFSQIRTKDCDELPVVLTRWQVVRLLEHVRLRRYRIPLKLIYCCGLRLSECLNLTVHDILGADGKLVVRGGKGGKDRMVPLAPTMLEDLRRYWAIHRNPVLVFPNVGRGACGPHKVAQRMRRATAPMPHSSLQRLLVEARKQLDIPGASPHSLRHSFATHLVEAGASMHTPQALLGHKNINTTMVYPHLTHRSEQDCRALVEKLCRELPR